MLNTMQYHAVQDLGYIVVTCTDTNMGYSAQVFFTPEQFERFKLWYSGGALIQDALYDLTDNEREIILTGMDEETWNATFPQEDEHEEERFDEPAF